MNTFDLNKLIGIPFKINRHDFKACDCRGIVCLYFKHVEDKVFPFTDGKRILFRDKKKDIDRMVTALDRIGEKVAFKDLREGDVVIFKLIRSFGALGVCINNIAFLHMDLAVGSCLTKLETLKKWFLCGYRINL